MNIDGVERQLPLFEPPIDPALLVRAVAAGLDLAAVFNDLGAPLPLHRFAVMLQKAVELSGELRSLGSSVLSAFEKKDAEELALLRSSHEMTLLKLTEQVRQQQIEESKTTIDGLRESRKTVEERYRHYQHLLATSDIKIPKPDEGFSLATIPTALAKSGLDAKEQGLGMSQTEQDQLHRLAEAQGFTLAGGISSAVAGVAFAVGVYPLTASVAQSIGHASNAASAVWHAAAGYASAFAGRDGIVGGYERRRDEWIFQSNMALRELLQIDRQTAAAEIREAIAENELSNTRQQITNAQEVDAFMRSKYSNRDLYVFMSSQLMSIYFRFYQIVFELAKRAERCFGFELRGPASSFIKTGYWDSARKGLLAGEQLHLDLRRMELAYLEQNKREFEITKHVSLLSLDPVALIQLRQTGRCEVNIPEALYDLDCPGHFMRRVKSVSLTIPCVTGPYTGVHCTLTLLYSSIRIRAALGSADYARQEEDSRFVDDYTSIQSIVTSSGQGDSGLFDANLRDERYLPFEGAGAMSSWRIALSNDFRSFDYDTISDVVLHLRYTARDGGEQLRQQATQELTAAVESFVQAHGEQGLARAFSLRHEFPTEWYRFLNPSGGATADQTLTLPLTKDRFPFLFQNRITGIDSMELFVKIKPEFSDSYNESTMKLSLQAGTNASNNPLALSTWNELLQTAESPGGSLGEWTLTAWLDIGGGLKERLEPNAIQDILLVCHYKCS